MVAALRFLVPGPPTPCARARVVNGHAFTPARTRAYEALVRASAAAAARAAGWAPPEDARFAVTLTIYRAALRGDWDNFAKGICDGMRGVAYPDDRVIAEAAVFMRLDRKNPRAEVEVRCLSAAEDVSGKDGAA